MKNIKKFTIPFGAILITLFMISSVTAVVTIESKETETQEEKTEAYINPNIHLTRAQLPILRRSVKNIDNTGVKTLVQTIINTIEDKGEVNSEDLKEIQKQLGLNYSIHSGIILSAGPGACYKFPGFVPLSILMTWPAIFSFCWWKGGNSGLRTATASFNGGKLPYQYIEGPHDGYAIGLTGLCYSGPEPLSGFPYYSIQGVCILSIIVT